MSLSDHHPTIRRKCARLFAITVKFVNISKQEAFDTLEEICDKILVAEEKHNFDSLLYHHHIYMRTIESFTPIQIKNIISICYHHHLNQNTINRIDSQEIDWGPSFDDEKSLIHVTTIKSEISYLKYITKEDCTPIKKGISDKMLSFYFQSIKWAMNTPNGYNPMDPYVLNHPQYHNLLSQVHSKVQEQKLIDNKQSLRIIYWAQREDEANWQDKIVHWWNDFLLNGHTHKKKQLYLYGASDVGKTTFVHNILKACANPPLTINENEDYDEYAYESQIFRPTPNDTRFAWQDFEPKIHNMVLIDEFDILQFDVSDFKKAIAGECLIANVKCQHSKKIRLLMPMIFISNKEPPKDDLSIKYRGLIERLFIVNADKKLY